MKKEGRKMKKLEGEEGEEEERGRKRKECDRREREGKVGLGRSLAVFSDSTFGHTLSM